MRALVRQEMEAGALGIGSSLIYAPGLLCVDRGADRAVQGRGAVRRQVHLAHAQRGQPAARGGRRADPRSAARRSIPAEIYHLKAAGQANWPKMDQVIAKIEGRARDGPEDHRRHVHLHGGRDRARRLDAAVGARRRLRRRLQAAAPIRRRARRSRRRSARPATDWENLYLAAGSPDRMLLVEFKSDALKPLTGKTLAEAARAARRGSGRHRS